MVLQKSANALQRKRIRPERSCRNGKRLSCYASKKRLSSRCKSDVRVICPQIVSLSGKEIRAKISGTMTYFQTAQRLLREGNRLEAARFLHYARDYGSLEERAEAEHILRSEFPAFDIKNYETLVALRRRAEREHQRREREALRRMFFSTNTEHNSPPSAPWGLQPAPRRQEYSGFASTQMRRALSDEEIRRAAPAVFAENQWSELSDSYQFFRTDTLIREMRNVGLEVVEVRQNNSIIPERAMRTKHMLRFIHRDRLNSRGYAQGNEIPEILLINSHDGRSSWQLRGGIFRVVCSNGLIVSSGNFGAVNIRHIGHSYEDVISASLKITERMPAIQEKITEMKSVELAPERRHEMAHFAAKLLGGKTQLHNPLDLLTPRRYSDDGRSLWTTFNVIQENLVRGGLAISGENRSRDTYYSRRAPTRSRQITSINRDIFVNTRLWALAENYLEKNSEFSQP